MKEVTDFNYECEITETREISITSLDQLLSGEKKLGRIGIKIDTEGFQLNVINFASNILKKTDFLVT